MIKKRFRLVLLLILLAVSVCCIFAACNKANTNPNDDDDDYVKPVTEYTVNDAMEDIYNGLVAGGETLKSMKSRYVESEYTLYTNNVNYTIVYKAVYAENKPDSKIYVSVFDNDVYRERVVLYYDSKDLYVRSTGSQKVVSNFSSTMMFDVFYSVVQYLDITQQFYGGTVAQIFNVENSDLNLSLLLSAEDISYIKVSENEESIEINGVDISIINDVVAANMDLYLNDIGDKFDILTEKYLDFKLSRLLESRFAYIFADNITVQMRDAVATTTKWKASGTMRDGSDYFVQADISYNDTTTKIEEGSSFIKSKYEEITLGKNDLLGTIYIPAVSDELFDMEVVTSLNSNDNTINQMTMRIYDAQGDDFIGAYYRNQIMYLDTSGLYNWVGGTVDLDSLHLPKVYFDSINFTTLMVAGYNDLLKAILIMLDKDIDIGQSDNEDLYHIIMENFTYDDTNTIYYTITEELIQKIREDDKSLMTMVAELLKIDQTRLESYLGEDFFKDARFVLSYNLDTGKVGLTMYEKDTLIFQCYLLRKDFDGLIFPVDTTMDSFAYSELVMPSVTTAEFSAELRVANAKTETNLSKVFGALIGDCSGNNTKYILKSPDRLVLKGEVSETFVVNSDGETVVDNMVKVYVYRKTSSEETLMLSVFTNPSDNSQVLVEYYLPIGDYINTTGLKFKVDKTVLKDAFNELLGDDNIFTEDNAFGIVDALLGSQNSYSSITKITEDGKGWLSFSVMVTGEEDPIYDLVGVKDTMASVKLRVKFSYLDMSEIIPANYVTPTLSGLGNAIVESVYSNNSAWKDNIEAYFGGQPVNFVPNYAAESITVVTGQSIYNPTAYLFGEAVTYKVEILNENGTYRVERIVSDTIIIDPTYQKTLPTEIEVLYDNGKTGFLNCSIQNFDSANITLAGYNLSGFNKVFTDDMLSVAHIGNNSIMEISFPVYILVQNRSIIVENETSEMAPIVGSIQIDPYTYALKKLADANYNPIENGLNNSDIILNFKNVYGYEDVVENDKIVKKPLTYDQYGYNKFALKELDLDWEYDISAITWRGSQSYAYAYFGDRDNGYAIRLALRVNVKVREVENVKIDDEDLGKYTIDFLIESTYNLPVQTSENHSVKLYFKNDPGSFRYVNTRPGNIDDETYYNNYLPIQLLWAGRDKIASAINVNGTGALFGDSDVTTATFGSELGVGEQTVELRVVVPSRYLATGTMKSYTLVTKYDLSPSGELSSTKDSVYLTKAKFSEDGEFYTPFEINPYDASSYLPSGVYLQVDKTWSNNSNDENNKIVKYYDVTWVTTDNKETPTELNIIRKKDNGYVLANPVTAQTDLVVYGKIGGSKGQIWITMSIRNLASELQSITYFESYDYSEYIVSEGLPTTIFRNESHYINNKETVVSKAYDVNWLTTNLNGDETGIVYLGSNGKYLFNQSVVAVNKELTVYGKAKNSLGQDIWVILNILLTELNVQEIKYVGLEYGTDSITIDPYKDYYLPSGFVAVLESGAEIIRRDIVWEVNDGISEDWYPSVYSVGCEPTMYDKNGKFLFSYTGGTYYIRYIIDGGDDIISQELRLEVNVLARTIVPDMVEIYNESSRSASVGYSDINYYGKDSTTLLNRLNTLYVGGGNSDYVGVYFDEAKTEGVNDRYTLHVDWNRQQESESGYENSIIRLINALQHPTPSFTMDLQGTIYTGTVNEQSLSITFTFSNLIVQGLSFENVRNMATGTDPAIMITLQNESYFIDYEELYDVVSLKNVLRITINKSFALTSPNSEGTEKYASPYQYFQYLFSKVVLYYLNGNNITSVPSVDFGTFNANTFNNNILGAGLAVGDYSSSTIRLSKLSEGSALDEIIVEIRALVDQRLTSDETIYAELYNEDSTERYSESYPLPTYIDVSYRYSGMVRYDVSEWTVGSTSVSILNVNKTTGIPVRLIDTLRLGGGVEGTYYNFTYALPCENSDFFLSVYIPKKNINKIFYSAEGETSLYNIVNGCLTIENPYLYYVENSRYGLNEKLIPTTIDADIVANYYSSTDINSYYIDWTFREGVFTEEIFRTGCAKTLFATATIKCYYDITKRNDQTAAGQTQTIELYIKVSPMEFSGISYQDMTIVEGEDENLNLKKNTITLDPYNDRMNNNGVLSLPSRGMTVWFNGESDSYTFQNVTYRLLDSSGNTRDAITEITYNQYGHTLNYAYLENDGEILLRMYISGYPYNEVDYSGGILLRVVIYRRVVEAVNLTNIVIKEGENTNVDLPSLYYIDPYNTITFALPSKAGIKFEESADYSQQTIRGWEIKIGNEWKDLNLSSTFYSQQSTLDKSTYYGFYSGNAEAYKGGVYDLRGFIRVGSSGTVIGQQYFEIKVIVLNRSLQTAYSTSYHYSDPLGGLLSDIPGDLNQEMFVDYDKYYLGIISPDYYYSKLGTPILPSVVWNRFISDDEVNSIGGFDKNITGYVAYDNTNTSYLYNIYKDEVQKEYDELLKAIMWDAYFNSEGAPLVNYSGQASEKLRELSEILENEVILFTYELLSEKLNNSTVESDRENGSYLVNGLAVMTAEQLGIPVAGNMDLVSVELFKQLKAEYDEWVANGSKDSDKSKDVVVYIAWADIYNEFKSSGAVTDADLSEYQLLKIAKYNEANAESNNKFSSTDREYNARVYVKLSENLRIYRNKEIWDRLYDRVTLAERQRMNIILNDATTADLKSAALSSYVGTKLKILNAYGEAATAQITAPAMEFSDIFETGDIAHSQALTEFLFNIFDSASMDESVVAEFLINYEAYYAPYIEEAMEKAWNKYRESVKVATIEEFITEFIRETVNTIVPTYEDVLGNIHKVVDFDYSSYNSNNSTNGTYWETIYSYLENNATNAVDSVEGAPQVKWNAAYEAYLIDGNDTMMALMDNILAETENGANYSAALEVYRTELKKIATAEMDEILVAEAAEANAFVYEKIVKGNEPFASGLHFDAKGNFAAMFLTTAETIYDDFYASYSGSNDGDSDALTSIDEIFANNDSTKSHTLWYYMYSGDNTISTQIRTRAEEIFFWYMQGDIAFDLMYNNAEKLNLTKNRIDDYLSLLNIVPTDYGTMFYDAENNLNEDEWTSFKKAKLFRQMKNYFTSAPYNAYMTAFYEEALTDSRNEAFINLYNSYVDLDEAYNQNYAELLVEKRNTSYSINKNAFNSFVEKYVEMANTDLQIYYDEIEEYKNKNIFSYAEEIYNYLNLDENGFTYKNELNLDADDISVVKVETVNYYYNTVATAEEKLVLDYYRALYAENEALIYSAVCDSNNVSDTIKQKLMSCYYYCTVQKALFNVELTIYGTGVDLTDEYFNIKVADVQRLIRIACYNSSTATLPSTIDAVIDAHASEDYYSYWYLQAINPYTLVYDSELLKLEKEYYKKLYDRLYAENKVYFDTIMERKYAEDILANNIADDAYIKLSAYGILGTLLVDNEMQMIYDIIDAVKKEKASEIVYDTLEFFTIAGDYNTYATDIYNYYAGAYALIYASANETEKAGLNNVTGITEDTTLAEYFTLYEALLSTDCGDVQTLIDSMLREWENFDFSVWGNDNDKIIINNIYLGEQQRRFASASEINEGYAKVMAVKKVLAILKAMDEAEISIDKNLFTDEYLMTGSLVGLDNSFKTKWIELLQEAFELSDINPTYFNRILSDNTYDFVISNADLSDEYTDIENEVIAKLLKTSLHSTIESMEEGGTVKLYNYLLSINKKLVTDSTLANENALGILPLSYYSSQAMGYDDASYQIVFDKLNANRKIDITFYSEDYLSNEDSEQKRHAIVFDKEDLIAENEATQIESIYISNLYKSNSLSDYVFKKDGILYKYIQMNITYVDFFGRTNVDEVATYTDANRITIDPFAPTLPTEVQAYAAFTADGTLHDVGKVTVTYSEEFYENIYSGAMDREYQILLSDSKGRTNTLIIKVDYVDRSVNRMFATDINYGGVKVSAVDVENSAFAGFYNLYDIDKRTNIISINPINEAVLSISDKQYVLPKTLGVLFNNGDVGKYENVVWDVSQTQYQLKAQSNIKLRILAYDVANESGDGKKHLEFSYADGNQKITITEYDSDNRELSSASYDNVPDYAVWNVSFVSYNQSLTTLNFENDEEIMTTLGNYNEISNYIDVEESTYSLNPYDIIYPNKIEMTFAGGDSKEFVPNWSLESGIYGNYKLKDILTGDAQDRYIVAVFSYLGYTIRVRFVTRDIELEAVDTENGEYLDGGILYLVRDAGSAYEQMHNNYSFVYYNFAKTINTVNWQKTPLSFIDNELNKITTTAERRFESIKGVLGWDKEKYPDMNFSSNIEFTVIVIDPKLYSTLSKNLNPYTVYDYISTPNDSNYQKKKDANEPDTIGNYFVQLGESRDNDIYFNINDAETTYKIVDNKIYYTVEYAMTSTNSKLAFDDRGGKTMNFEIVLPLTPYLYTNISSPKFVKTASEGQTANLWSWTTTPETSSEYKDAIYWPLGTALKASELPRAKDSFTGQEISLLWELDDVNVNLATSSGYMVKGWYYSSLSVWKYLELTIFIDKVDKKLNLLNNLGGNYALVTNFNGKYYYLPINHMDNSLKFLRSDGTFDYLNETDYIVEYKPLSANDSAYSATNYPLNAGEYSIKVSIDDYNVYIKDDIVFTLTINAITIDSEGIVFKGDEESLSGTIQYVYDGNEHSLVVQSGLPLVQIDNWFESIAEKNALVDKYKNQGYDETASKTRAYLELYSRVTAATRIYLDNCIADLRKETNENELALLYAMLFERLTPNMGICEVVYSITYRNSHDVQLTNPPVDVGTYTVIFEINANDNNGNYLFNASRLSRSIEIVQPDITYSLASNVLVYTGRLQNPLINGLHNADGELPNGVNVTYNYSYTDNDGITKYLTNGVINEGVYYCDISIDGGINYPSINMQTLTVSITAKPLYVNIENMRAEYLSDVLSINDYLTFNGLVGLDKPKNFGFVQTETEVESFYTLGHYSVYIKGFMLTASSITTYTEIDLSTEYIIDGKIYHELILKDVSKDGSLFKERDENNNYIYADIISYFKNYAIYVVSEGDYEIYAEEDAVIISNDTEWQSAIASVAQNDRLKLYLVAGTYSAVTLNVNADITIIGCYDNDKNILTEIAGITVNAGVLTIKIIKFSAVALGSVGLQINDDVGLVSVYDSLFDGNDVNYSVAIKTSVNFTDKLYVVNTTIEDYHRGVELNNGNLEMDNCIVKNNNYGISVLSDLRDIRITQTSFNGHDVGVYATSETLVVLYNTFTYNRIGIKMPNIGNDTEMGTNNTFDMTNGSAIDHTL